MQKGRGREKTVIIVGDEISLMSFVHALWQRILTGKNGFSFKKKSHLPKVLDYWILLSANKVPQFFWLYFSSSQHLLTYREMSQWSLVSPSLDILGSKHGGEVVLLKCLRFYWWKPTFIYESNWTKRKPTENTMKLLFWWESFSLGPFYDSQSKKTSSLSVINLVKIMQ